MRRSGPVSCVRAVSRRSRAAANPQQTRGKANAEPRKGGTRAKMNPLVWRVYPLPRALEMAYRHSNLSPGALASVVVHPLAQGER